MRMCREYRFFRVGQDAIGPRQNLRAERAKMGRRSGPTQDKARVRGQATVDACWHAAGTGRFRDHQVRTACEKACKGPCADPATLADEPMHFKTEAAVRNRPAERLQQRPIFTDEERRSKGLHTGPAHSLDVQRIQQLASVEQQRVGGRALGSNSRHGAASKLVIHILVKNCIARFRRTDFCDNKTRNAKTARKNRNPGTFCVRSRTTIPYPRGDTFGMVLAIAGVPCGSGSEAS
jgi:hypothetical protein